MIGVAFDGTGYGTDGAIWGGEFLAGDYRGFRRAAHLRYVAMPGGEQAIREPWRMAGGPPDRRGAGRRLLAGPRAAAAPRTRSARHDRSPASTHPPPPARAGCSTRGRPGRRPRPGELRGPGRHGAGMAGLAASPATGVYPFELDESVRSRAAHRS